VDNNYLDLGMNKSGFVHTLPSGRLIDVEILPSVSQICLRPIGRRLTAPDLLLVLWKWKHRCACAVVPCRDGRWRRVEAWNACRSVATRREGFRVGEQGCGCVAQNEGGTMRLVGS
jgi:hypothetical protein